MPSANIKQAGVWKTAKNLYVRQGGVWKTVQNAYIRQGGVWKKFYQRTTEFTFVASRVGGYLGEIGVMLNSDGSAWMGTVLARNPFRGAEVTGIVWWPAIAYDPDEINVYTVARPQSVGLRLNGADYAYTSSAVIAPTSAGVSWRTVLRGQNPFVEGGVYTAT